MRHFMRVYTSLFAEAKTIFRERYTIIDLEIISYVPSIYVMDDCE